MAGRLANKLSTPQIQVAEGKVHLDENPGGTTGGITYLAYIGRKKFALGEDMGGVIQVGSRYRVFYVKLGVMEFVLSYERVP